MIEVIKMKNRGLFIRIETTDAIRLINSLTSQILANSPNIGRWEPLDIKGKGITIAVMPGGVD